MKYMFKMIIVFLALGMSSMIGCKKAASFKNEKTPIEHTLKKLGENLKKKHKETRAT